MKFDSAFSRCFWGTPPCIASASIPKSFSSWATRSVPCLVAQNTSVRPVFSMIDAATLALSRSCTLRNVWCISSTVSPLEATSWKLGSSW